MKANYLRTPGSDGGIARATSEDRPHVARRLCRWRGGCLPATIATVLSTPSATASWPTTTRRHMECKRVGAWMDVVFDGLLQCRYQPHHIVDIALALRSLPPLVEIQFPGNSSVSVCDRLQVGNELLTG